MRRRANALNLSGMKLRERGAHRFISGEFQGRRPRVQDQNNAIHGDPHACFSLSLRRPACRPRTPFLTSFSTSSERALRGACAKATRLFTTQRLAPCRGWRYDTERHEFIRFGNHALGRQRRDDRDFGRQGFLRPERSRFDLNHQLAPSGHDMQSTININRIARHAG